MASTMEEPRLQALKGKLTDVKSLLKTANNRLQEEVSKYEIFTTKASAASGSASNTCRLNGGGDQDTRADIIRTITDISTLESVLSCPIFDRIVNVTDSLDQLSYQLNLHPSITEFDIDPNSGELILTPPMEFTALNDFIPNSMATTQFSDNQLEVSLNFAQNTTALVTDIPVHQTNSADFSFSSNADTNNGYARAYPERNGHQSKQNSSQTPSAHKVQNYHHVLSPGIASPSSGANNENNIIKNNNKNNNNVDNNNTEKLIANGNPRFGDVAQSNDEPLYLQPTSIEPQDADRRRYKSNGHFTPDNGIDEVKNQFQSTQSINQVDSHNNEQRRSSYTNELYKTSHGLNQPPPHDKAINQHFNNNQHQKYLQKQRQQQQRQQPLHQQQPTPQQQQQHQQLQQQQQPQQQLQQQQQQHQQQQQRTTRPSEQNHNNSQRDVNPNNPTANGRFQMNQVAAGIQYNRGSCSPSSAGSTVRLADECDSGASSYQSQQARGSLPSFQSKGIDGSVVNGSAACYDSVEQELIRKLSPELERIKVTLERDDMGLGITIAGYTLQEDEEISGIFIKSVTPGSPAARCGKIKEFDQIFSVNGNELVGYSNDEALVLLRQTGKIVTLELMRHSDELKHNKLKAALARAQCPHKLSSKRSDSLKSATRDADNEEGVNNVPTPAKSSIPVSRSRDSANNSPTKPPVSTKPKTALVQVSTYQESSARKAQEAIYKNDPLSKSEATPPTRGSGEVTSPLSPSHIPVAAQRGGTNKVIETKQGSRNTIDIRSPACQTATATYVNRVDDMDQSDPTTRQNITDRLRREASDEFGRLLPSEEPEWDKDAKIVVLHKEKPSQGLGFAVKEYANPKNPAQPIIMITSITPGGIADRDGRLSVGDLLIFVDDNDLRGQVLSEAVKALKKTDGEASLGVLKLKRN